MARATINPTSAQKETETLEDNLNRLFGVALDAHEFRSLFKNNDDIGIPAYSPVASDLLGKTCYIQPGPATYGDSIKAQAAWGFYGYFYGKRLRLLRTQEGYELQTLRSQFLKAHGIEKPNGFLQQVSLEHLAAWLAFKNLEFVCPSSGSFALGFAKVLHQLRQTEITLIHKNDKGEETKQKIKLLSDDECLVTAFLPSAKAAGKDDEIISVEKLALISREFELMKCTIVSWEKPEERDFDAFSYAVSQIQKNSGMFCATNPMSAEQVNATILAKLQKRYGLEFVEKNSTRFEDIGIKFKRTVSGKLDKDADNCIQIESAPPIDQSIGGLMLAKLDALEEFLKHNLGKKHISVHQSSSGATLAGAAAVALIIKKQLSEGFLTEENQKRLETHFPHLYKALITEKDKELEVLVSDYYDPGNPKLAEALGFPHQNQTSDTEIKEEKAVNGLDSFSRSGASEKLLLAAKEQQLLMALKPSGHALMELARVIILIHNIQVHECKSEKVRYPESAGAAALGGELQKVISEDMSKDPAKVKSLAKRAALLLKDNHIDITRLCKLIIDPTQSLDKALAKKAIEDFFHTKPEVIEGSNTRIFIDGLILELATEKSMFSSMFASSVPASSHAKTVLGGERKNSPVLGPRTAPTLPNRSLSYSPATNKPANDDDIPSIFMNTGSNGTEQYQDIIKSICSELLNQKAKSR